MAIRRYRKHEREIITRIVLDGMLQHMPQERILKILEARGFPMSQPNLSLYYRKIRKGWAIKNEQDRDVLKSEKRAELTLIKTENWAEWQRSKEVAKTNIEKRKSGSQKKGVKGRLQELTERLEEQCGDPRYMKIILDAIEREMNLDGLSEPTVQELRHRGKVVILPDNGRDEIEGQAE